MNIYNLSKSDCGRVGIYLYEARHHVMGEMSGNIKDSKLEHKYIVFFEITIDFIYSIQMCEYNENFH